MVTTTKLLLEINSPNTPQNDLRAHVFKTAVYQPYPK